MLRHHDIALVPIALGEYISNQPGHHRGLSLPLCCGVSTTALSSSGDLPTAANSGTDNAYCISAS